MFFPEKICCTADVRIICLYGLHTKHGVIRNVLSGTKNRTNRCTVRPCGTAQGDQPVGTAGHAVQIFVFIAAYGMYVYQEYLTAEFASKSFCLIAEKYRRIAENQRCGGHVSAL